MLRWILALLVTVIVALPHVGSAQTASDAGGDQERFLNPDEVVALGRAYRLRHTQAAVGSAALTMGLLVMHEVNGDYLDLHDQFAASILAGVGLYAYNVYASARTSYWLDEAGLPINRTRAVSWGLVASSALFTLLGAATYSPGVSVFGGFALFGAGVILPMVQTGLQNHALSWVPLAHPAHRGYLSALVWTPWITLPLAGIAVGLSDTWGDHRWFTPMMGGSALALVGASVWSAQALVNQGASLNTVPMSAALVLGIASVVVAGRDSLDPNYWYEGDNQLSWSLAAASVAAAAVQSYLNAEAIEGLTLQPVRPRDTEEDARRLEWIVAPTVIERSAGLAVSGRF